MGKPIFWCCAVLVFWVVGCGETGANGGQGGSGGESGRSFDCTEEGIRAAVAAGGGPHTFLCDGPTSVVTEAVIQIDSDLILDGEGNLTIDGGGDHRIFLVGPFPGSILEPWQVELRNLNLTGGFAESVDLGDGAMTDGAGGAVESFSDLTISNCVISDNTASQGSAIASYGRRLSIEDSTISDNEGVWAIDHQGAEMSIERSTISGNIGGGVLFLGTFGFIVDCTISDNAAPEGKDGGGILNWSDLEVILTTISGNQAERGGGIWNGGDLRLGTSTVSGNSAVEGGGVFNADPFEPDRPVSTIGVLHITYSTISGNAAERGAGVYTAGLWQRIENSTISGNSAEQGGGIAMAGTLEGPSSLTLANNTVAANAAMQGSAIWAAGESPELRFVGNVIDGSCQAGEGTATWVSLGSNIESPGATCGFTDLADLADVSAQALSLSPLADNGGATETHAPMPGSVAIDAMVPEDCARSLPEPLVDQRFVIRPVGSACDAGSVEVE